MGHALWTPLSWRKVLGKLLIIIPFRFPRAVHTMPILLHTSPPTLNASLLDWITTKSWCVPEKRIAQSHNMLKKSIIFLNPLFHFVLNYDLSFQRSIMFSYWTLSYISFEFMLHKTIRFSWSSVSAIIFCLLNSPPKLVTGVVSSAKLRLLSI